MVQDNKDEVLFSFNRETYGSIIKEARVKMGINQPTLARLLNVSKSYISNWEQGRARPDLNIVPKLCDTLGISVSAFFGRDTDGIRLKKDEHELLTSYRALNKQNKEMARDIITRMTETQFRQRRCYFKSAFRKIFVNELSASAGLGNPLTEGGEGESVFIRKNSLTDLADAVINVWGDSMEPEYQNGDRLLVKYTDSISFGDIGIFVLNGEGYVKQLSKKGLHSLNPAYKDIEISEFDSFMCVGKVLGVLQSSDLPNKEEQCEINAFVREGAL